MAEIFSDIVTFFMTIILGILNFGGDTLTQEHNLVNGRFRRSTLDDFPCPANYYCLPRSSCQQPEFFNPVERSIISSTSCQPDFKSSESYVCCPKKPEQSAQPSIPDQSSMSALKVVKGMGDKMLRIMLDPKKNVNQQSKIASQSKSDSVEGYDGYMDEILSTLENMKS